MKRSLFRIFVIVSTLFVSGCYYDWIVPEAETVIPPGVEISFAQDVVPIFTAGNNCTSCHRTGGIPPDLTAGNAYNQINTSKYLNRDVPAESGIYKIAAPNSTTHRHKTYTAQQAALILAWIEQGAKNN